MSEELQEVKYYELMNYKDSKTVIKSNMNQITNNFVAIGYYLKHIRDKELYVEDGYQNIWDMAQSEFGFSQSWASRCMSVNDRFSKDGNSPIILEEYKGFDKSKLSEMLTLTDQQLEQVTIMTTVAEIKDIKRSEKSYATSHKEPEVISTSKQDAESKLCKWDGKTNCVAVCTTGAECCAECEDHGHCNGECGWQDERIPKPSGKCIHRPEYPCTLPEASKLAIGNGEKCNAKCCWGCEKHKKCGYECNSSVQRPVVTEAVETVPEYTETVSEIEENVIEEPESVAETECRSCKYDNMSPDEYFKDHPNTTIFPCNECNDKLDRWWPKDFEPVTNSEPVETIEADIIQTVPEDPEQYSFQDVKDEYEKLTEYVDTYRKTNEIMPGRRKAKMRLDAITLLGKEMQKPSVVEEPKTVQPELPIFKNNDQRKEWAENYKVWGEWYYDKHIDCHYYKYEFPNGDRLVVEEYRERELYWKSAKHDEQHYHLLEKHKEAYGSKRTYEKKYDHGTTSMSEITEYLKNLQKMGV